MTQRDIEIVRTNDPNGEALATMGEVARKASTTWALEEWASRLAAKAGPRDSLGQLRELYNGILDRWRYVQEQGERVANTPRALLGNVLGLSYQVGGDPTTARVPDGPAKRGTHGFGDCDDVAALTAAGALALGFTPFFRVARAGIAHVSCLVRIPDGRTISVDPVGHPQYPFGWALPARDVRVYTLSGQPALVSAAKGLSGIPMQTYQVSTPTLFAGFDSGYEPTAQTPIGHWCATPRSDQNGPRVIAMPERFHRLFMHGIAVDGAPGVDEEGHSLRYDAMRDLWIDDRLAKNQAGAMGAGFFSRMARRWKKRIAGVRKVINRIAAPIRALTAKLMTSKVAQNIVGGVLMSVGIPRAATKAVLQASGEILKRGGLPALIRLIRKNPKAALQMVAQAAKAGLKRATQIFSGVEDVPQYMVTQSGGQFTGHPVMALVGVPYVADFGEIDISETPAPGRWYRIKKGDTLLTVAQRAYGVATGTPRLTRAKWINEAHANAPFFDPNAKDNLFKKGKLSFAAKWSSDPEDAAAGTKGKSYAVIWIPTTLGDEPTAKVPAHLPDVGPNTGPSQVPDTHPTTPADALRPTPGSYYQVRRGDSLLAVAGAAFGLKSGKERLARAHWINDAVANRPFVKSSLRDAMFPSGRISFSSPYPRIWIPLQKGDEPVKQDGGDLPPEDHKIPADPTIPPVKPPKTPDRPKETEAEKLRKFREACERTPNGHFVQTKTGPGCSVCHPENNEVWNPVTQRCQQRPTTQIPQTDPLAQEKAVCAATGGTWDHAKNACITKQTQTPDVPDNVPDVPDVPTNDPGAECKAAGGIWDPGTGSCYPRNTTPDVSPHEDKGSGILPLVAAGLLFAALSK